MDKTKVGLLAASAAAMFIATPIALAGPKVVDGHYCQNNKCKGNSSCGGYGNSAGCNGTNSCKGKGWLKDKVTKATCEKGKLGKWVPVPKKKDKKKK
jgi:hypothetical protein